MRDILSEKNSLLYNVCVHDYIHPVSDFNHTLVNQNQREKKMPQPQKTYHQNEGRMYIAPDNIKAFDAMPMAPSHAGILNLIREAKDANHHWADAALAEICFITGINYKFIRLSAPLVCVEKHDIVMS